MRWLAALVATAACGRVGFESRDVAIDAPVMPDARVPPAARVASTAYWTNWFGPQFGTAGMSMAGYSIDVVNVVDGDLLILVACIDNGSDTLWPDPIAPGFTQLYQRRWGNDGQTCAVSYKRASNEPATYAGTYGPGIVSASAVLTLVAISGASSTAPIGASAFLPGTGAGTNPVIASSPGVTTTRPDSLVLYAMNSDWECFEVTDVTFTVPAGFDELRVLSDQGSATTKDWTIVQLATRAMPTPGDTGPITNTETSTGTAACKAVPWTATIVVQP